MSKELEDMELELDVAIEQKRRALDSAGYWMDKYQKLKEEMDSAVVIDAYTLEMPDTGAPQWNRIGLVRTLPVKEKRDEG